MSVPENVLAIPEIAKLHKKLLKTERKRLKLEMNWITHLLGSTIARNDNE